MSARRRRRAEVSEERGDSRRAEGGDRRRPSRTGALRKNREDKRTRTTIAVVAMAVLCVPLALWLYPKLTSQTQLSKLGVLQLETTDKTSAQLTGIRRRQEAVNGAFSLLVSCEVYNGTVEAVTGVSVKLVALDEAGATVMERTGEPADFTLDGRATERVEVGLTGLTPKNVERIAFLRLLSTGG